MRLRLAIACLVVCCCIYASPAVAQMSPVSIAPKVAASADDDSSFMIAGGGNLNTNPGGNGASGGSGLFGASYEKTDSYFGSFLLNLAASQGPSSGPTAIGAALLNPSSQQNGYGFAAAKWRPTSWGVVGGGVRIGGNTLSLQAADKAIAPVDGGVLYFSPSLQIGSKVKSIKIGDDPEANKIRFMIDVAYAVRKLYGTLGQDSSAAFRARPDVLGTDQTSFHGLECSFLLNLNDVQGYFKISDFSSPVDISGFSGLQVTFGVNALATLIKTK